MSKLLSIVIPVYKVEDFIRKCIESLIVPDKKQFELLDIVIVNDGTPDNSANIAREYEAKYPSVIRVIDQENRGHGGAWNHGTELAVGKYLFYLDSDDWFDTDQFSKLIKYLGHCNTDLVLIDKQHYFAATDMYEPEYTHRQILKPDVVYKCDEYDWIGCQVGFKMTYAQNTIYRTSMLQQYMPLFCEHVMYDDVSFQVIPIVIAHDFIYTPLNVYRYYIGRPGQSFDPKVFAKRGAENKTKVLKFLLEWMKKNDAKIPNDGNRRVWLDHNYYAICVWHYHDLSALPYSMARSWMKEWDEFVQKDYPDIKNDVLVRRYRALPFFVFYYDLAARNFIERVKNFLKRKFGK